MAEEKGKERPMISAMHKGPAPNAYALPPLVGYEGHDVTKWRMPAFTMRPAARTTARHTGPGPKYGIAKNLTRYGPNGTPQITMAPKLRSTAWFNVPGPPTYRAEEVPPMRTHRAPAYSLAFRTQLHKENANPAPNSYRLPVCLGPSQPYNTSGPAYTMANRGKDFRRSVGPGPARYPATDPYVNRGRPPQYSLSGRRGALAAHPGPGPGAYLPGHMRCSNAPGFSFGVKHSPYKRLPTVPADNEI